MRDDAREPEDPQKLRFSTESGAERAGEQQGEDAANEFWAFVAEQRERGDQVFTVEDLVEDSGLRFDFGRDVIARFRRFIDEDDITDVRVFEQFTLLEDEERSRTLVRAQVDGGFEATFPLAAWSPGVPARLPDYADDDPETREYVLSTDAGDTQRLRIRHPNETTYALQAFLVRHSGQNVSIEDPEGGEHLVLMRGEQIIARTAGFADGDGDGAAAPSARTEFMKVDRPNRYAPAAHLFFEDGFAGLDQYGQWFTDLQDLGLPPAAQGLLRAASFGSRAEVLSEVGRIWADSGVVDPTDRYRVFFDSSSLGEAEAERAELLALLGKLGLEPAELPAGAQSGEVWVPRDGDLDAEIDRWA